MSEKTQNHYAPFPPVEKRSVRFFVDDPDVGWTVIGSKRFLDIYNGRIPVPKWAGKTYRGACAFVEVDGRKVVALNRIGISNWKIGDDGFTNPDELMMPTADYSDPSHPTPVQNPDSIPMEDDVVAIKRCLGLSG